MEEQEYSGKGQVNEEYPSGWDMEYFISLPNKTQKMKYARNHLTKLGCGSSRCVFNVDNKKVLKLAKTRHSNELDSKGIAQNLKEIDMATDPYLNTILPNIHDYSEKGYWVEFDYIKPFRDEKHWEAVFGFPFGALVGYIQDGIGTRYNYEYKTYRDYYDEVSEDEFANDIYTFLVHAPDLLKKGKVLRDYFNVRHYGLDNDGKPKLMDFGLDWEIWNRFYER